MRVCLLVLAALVFQQPGHADTFLAISADGGSLIEFSLQGYGPAEIHDRYFQGDDKYLFRNLAVVHGRVIVSGNRSLPGNRFRAFFGELRNGEVVEFGEGRYATGPSTNNRVFFFRASAGGDKPFVLNVATLDESGISDTRELLNAFPLTGTRPVTVGRYLAFYDQYSQRTLIMDMSESQAIETPLRDCVPELQMSSGHILCHDLESRSSYSTSIEGASTTDIRIDRHAVAFAHASDSARLYIASRIWSWRRLGEIQAWYALDLPRQETRRIRGEVFPVNPASVIRYPARPR